MLSRGEHAIVSRLIKSLSSRASRIDGMAAMLRGAGTSAGLRFAAAGLSFGVQIALARLMGAGQYGLFVVMLSSVAVLALPVSLGLDLSIIRFLPAFVRDNDGAALKGLVRRAVTLALVLGTLSALLWVGTAHWITGESPGVTALIASAALVPAFGLVAIGTGILRALHRIGRAQLPTDVIDPILLVGIIALAYAAVGRVDATMAIWVKLLAVGVSVAMLGLWSSRGLRPLMAGAVPRYDTAAWVKVGIPLIVIGGSVVLLGRLDTLMVSALVSPTEAGIYLVALKVGTLIEMVMAAVNTIAAPLIAGFHARADYAGLERLLRTTTVGVFGIVLAVAAFVFFAGGDLLGLFGQEFRQGQAALTVLIFGWVAASITAPVDLLGGMTGHQRETAGVMVAAIVLNAALNLVLIPRAGIAGAAWASVITMLVWRLVLSLYLGFKLRLNPTLLPFRLRPLPT